MGSTTLISSAFTALLNCAEVGRRNRILTNYRFLSHSPLKFLFPARIFTEIFPQSIPAVFLSNLSLFIFFRQSKTFQSFTSDKKIKSNQIPHLVKSLGSIKIKVNSEKENTVKAILKIAHSGR